MSHIHISLAAHHVCMAAILTMHFPLPGDVNCCSDAWLLYAQYARSE